MFPNPHLQRVHGTLSLENVPLPEIAARFGTPTYVYSQHAITQNLQAYQTALQGRAHRICYAMKANSNLSILKLLVGLGAGFDIVSAGELQRVLAAGGQAQQVVFSGVGKSHADITAALQAGVGCFNIESATELTRIMQIAQAHGVRAPVSFRVNPDVDPKTHPYISTGLKGNKFGVQFDTALDLYRKAAAHAHIAVVGIDAHIGSQITELAPYIEALDKMLDLVEALEREGIHIHHLDVGGVSSL
jgi:diaminopimelate decarboxylase